MRRSEFLRRLGLGLVGLPVVVEALEPNATEFRTEDWEVWAINRLYADNTSDPIGPADLRDHAVWSEVGETNSSVARS